MDSAHEKLLEAFEDFEAGLEAENVLKKVKEELVLGKGVIEFGEKLKEREHLKQVAQATRAARVATLQQLCYPQLTCQGFIDGLDYCWTNWHHQFKRPLTPPPAPPPSPNVNRRPPSQQPTTMHDLPTKQQRL